MPFGHVPVEQAALRCVQQRLRAARDVLERAVFEVLHVPERQQVFLLRRDEFRRVDVHHRIARGDPLARLVHVQFLDPPGVLDVDPGVHFLVVVEMADGPYGTGERPFPDGGGLHADVLYGDRVDHDGGVAGGTHGHGRPRSGHVALGPFVCRVGSHVGRFAGPVLVGRVLRLLIRRLLPRFAGPVLVGRVLVAHVRRMLIRGLLVHYGRRRLLHRRQVHLADRTLAGFLRDHVRVHPARPQLDRLGFAAVGRGRRLRITATGQHYQRRGGQQQDNQRGGQYARYSPYGRYGSYARYGLYGR